MKLLIVSITVLVTATFLTPVTHATQGVTTAVEAAQSIECPLSINLAIQNPPSGWSPFLPPGGAIQKFRAVSLSKEGTDSVVACFYDNSKEGFPPYALSRKVTGNFKCSVAPSASG